MGKSTTAEMFRDEGVPVWDADAAVARLYGKGGAAVPPIAALRPGAVRDGAVDRGALKSWIAEDETALGEIEAAVHPLVAADRRAFVEGAEAEIVVLDIPLLFEIGAQDDVDAVAVVSAPPEIQRDRVMARPGMTDEMFRTIIARQMPDAEKRVRADYVIETLTMDGARAAVRDILEKVRQRHA